MNIGVYVVSYAQSAGGGYTFEQEILTSLSRVAPYCNHQITIFYDDYMPGDKSTAFNPKNLRSIFLKQPVPKSKPKSLREKFTSRLAPRKFVEEENTFQQITERENIEFIWFPTPAYSYIEIPYIATMWDIQHRLQPWFPEVGRLPEWTGRESYYATHLRRASFLVVGTNIGAQELAFFYQIPMEHIRILPLPVPSIESLPTLEYVAKVLLKYNIPPNYLFYPAQFWSHKNHANLLLALQVLEKTYGEEKHLVLTGSDHGNLEHVRNLVHKLNLQDRVHFLGFVPRDELIALYSGAYALVFVSLFGPDNLPPLEAFKCNCPVIVSDYDGAREQYGDAPLFVNSLNPNEIAQAVYRLGQEPDLRRRLIEKGRQRAMVYSGTDYVHDIMKIFDDFEAIRRNWK